MAVAAAEDGTVKEGWAIPLNSRKAHYFRKGQALCNRWMFLGKIYADEQLATKPLPDDCKACWKVKIKEDTAAA